MRCGRRCLRGSRRTTRISSAALDSVVRSENARFTLVWEQASRAQRLVLQALAVEPGHLQSSAYRTKFGLPTASTVQRATEALLADELVEKQAGGTHAIVEPFLTEWVRRYSS